jgi:hypothetical protein
LAEDEAARLAAFVAPPPMRRGSLIEQVRDSLRL